MNHGLIGKNLVYSFSKIVHEALTDYTYQLYPLPTDEDFHSFMKEQKFPGINVTIPYKEMVIPYCHHVDEKAKNIGAVNTILNRDGKLYGYNTDYDGFLYMAQKNKISFQNKIVLILGTGGTFKTVSTVACDQGAKEILVASRTPKDPTTMTSVTETLTYDQAKSCEKVQIIVNTSPIGMYPDTHLSPISLDGFPNLEGVLDVVYNPLYSALVQEAKNKNIPSSGGLPMLVAQAKFAAEHFQGKEIPSSAMDKVVGQIAQRQSNLVLIGMPGCGKSTIGKYCAESMGRNYIDLDAELEKQAGKTIPQLFETEGEEAFRQLETKICQQFAKENNLIISTGGGVVTRPENIKALQQNGILVYLTRPLENLELGNNRPLSTSLDAVKTLEQQRTPLYQKACHFQVENTQAINKIGNQIQETYYEIFNSQWS